MQEATVPNHGPATAINDSNNGRFRNQSGATSIPRFVIQVTAIASIGGILFGYDLGVISDALPQLADSFDLSNVQQEWVVSSLYLGGGIGAAVGGTICDALGRKRGIIVTDVWFAIGALLLCTSQSLSQVIVGRVVVGFAVAVSGVADVSYLHEMAPPEWRGAVVSVNEACIALGFLLAYTVGFGFASWDAEDGWRGMFGISGLVAALQFVGMWNMPESPTWLELRGRHDEAAMARTQMGEKRPSMEELVTNEPDALMVAVPASRSADDLQSVSALEEHTEEGEAEAEEGAKAPRNVGDSMLRTFFECIWAQSSSSLHEAYNQYHYDNAPMCSVSWWYHGTSAALSRTKSSVKWFVHVMAVKYRPQSWIALFMSVTQQWCGQNNILSYAPSLFAATSRGSSSSQHLWLTMGIGFVKFIVTVVVITNIERIGRRVLLLSGMATIAMGLFILTWIFAALDRQDMIIDSDNAEDLNQNTGATMWALLGILLMVCGYSLSFGPLTWLLTSELFPTAIRGRALGASTIVTYLCASLVTSTFLSAQSWFTTSGVFAIYLVITVLGIVFAYRAIPDTGHGQTVEQIEQALQVMPWWRTQQRQIVQHPHHDCYNRPPQNDIFVESPSGRTSKLQLETELT